MKQYILCIVLLGVSFAHAEDADFESRRIPYKAVITDIPATTLDFLKESFSNEAIPAWAGIIASTGILYHYDEDLLLGAQATGRRWGLSNVDKTKTVAKLGNYDLLRLPTDTASALYFLGDGWTDMVATGAFWATGYFGKHVRPFNTSLQLLHGMTVSGIFVQLLKRATGRESPSERSEKRGAWRPFTPPSKYDKHVSKYDAYPSGHVMTTTLVFTIIRSNYPEYDHYLLPLEVTWISVLSFAMMNNAVHWASDYPLAIGMGYVIGKSSLKLGKPKTKEEAAKAETEWEFFPGVASDDSTTTINAIRSF